MLASIQKRHASAIEQLCQHCDSDKCEEIVENLSASLTQMRNLLVKRVHEDIEARFGVDSMIAPMSLSEEERELHHAKIEIEIYMIVITADEISHSGYIDDKDWTVEWLTRLRLGDDLPDDIAKRIQTYSQRSLQQRRLLFSDLLIRSLPEAQKAPLVIFRLFPKAIRLAVATAFMDPMRATELRNAQTSTLPAIADCPQCHGHPLESGENCQECGNPLWTFRWLNAAD